MSWLKSELYWICDVSSWIICALLSLLIFLFHSFKVYQDLFTKARKSISHRPHLPEINNIYILITICAFVTILMYTLSLIIGAIANMYFMSSLCTFTSISISCFWQIAKCGLYIVLLLRLHTVYKGSRYQYNFKKLSFIGIITLIINSILIILICAFTHSDYYQTYKFSYFAICCNTVIPPYLLYSSAVYDVIMSCACLFAFIVPLKQLIKDIPNETKSLSRHTALLATVGLKFLNVTMTAVLSSLCMLIIGGMTDSFLILSFDMVINSVCIVLMTPYYQDEMYYNRLCFCCIQGCNNCKYNGMDDKIDIVQRRMTIMNVSTPTADVGQSNQITLDLHNVVNSDSSPD